MSVSSVHIDEGDIKPASVWEPTAYFRMTTTTALARGVQ